ncbi:tannase and feruloyl esterase [Dothidotthia symphoricarpi CBS 119687]|uniref:Carboxylic ester hydrolase n=1 Tax=Dothidotthia symphoricarpi CBS 119687 TaxID=1392245 RepID=A0A6A6A5S7_9PLEO|nr:tannase and feruloyl esterase [Dothidotthia symphoricarpi CBS 119687]KAF2126128.1 tannase and feruloyl esterase [Dothidotthia symphoricarpi CBS 119687]
MRRKLNTLLSCVALIKVASCSCTPSFLQASLPTGASVNFAYSLQANSTFEVPAGDLGYPTNPVNLPALCAVSVQVKSVGNTTFGLGLFLPEAWNGRFLAVGQGGYSGGVNWADMAVGVRYGFAVISTDTGHNSTNSDGSWAYQQPDVVENWGHLALHGSVVIGKNVTAAYYQENVSYSYYSGCSTGGRQGLKEAELYPEDFDGIVAGAPAWWTSHLQPGTVRIALNNLPTTADYHISSAQFSVINAEVLKQCDPQDGLVDSIISDPQGCNFRPDALLCGANATANATNCLTGPQLDTIHNIWSDYVGENNTMILPGFWPGSEGTPALISVSAPNKLGTDYVKYFLGKGPQWNYTEYNDSIIKLSDEINPGNATVGFDLSAYEAKGGKLLSYHGAVDPLIPTGSTPYYYDHVLRTLQPRGVDVDSFFKYFIVPGMGHCMNTTAAFNAPWYFGGPNQAGVLGKTVHSVPGFEDKTHDVLLAMMAWVENGTVPEYIVGTKYVNETTHDKVMRQRPLCVYPKMAKWTGEGDVNSAETWSCESLY